MTEKEILKRRIELKNQALTLIKGELIYRLALMRLKEILEIQIKTKLDPVLSRKLDCVIYLLEH